MNEGIKQLYCLGFLEELSGVLSREGKTLKGDI